MPQVKDPPALMDAKALPGGVARLSTMPYSELAPQQTAAPSVFNAQVWLSHPTLTEVNEPLGGGEPCVSCRPQ